MKCGTATLSRKIQPLLTNEEIEWTKLNYISVPNHKTGQETQETNCQQNNIITSNDCGAFSRTTVSGTLPFCLLSGSQLSSGILQITHKRNM